MTVFGICSTINAPTYITNFTTEERFSQTLKTIESIKSKVTDPYIILCDNSPLTDEQKSILNSLVNKMILLHNEDHLFNHIESISYDLGLKSASEAYQMLNIIEFIKNIEYDLFFKISGRYFLNDDFNIDKFNKNKLNFREFNHYNRICYSTVLYGISKNHETTFKNKLIEIIPILKNGTIDIETALNSLKINENLVNNIDFLGVSGYIAPSKDFITH